MLSQGVCISMGYATQSNLVFVYLKRGLSLHSLVK